MKTFSSKLTLKVVVVAVFSILVVPAQSQNARPQRGGGARGGGGPRIGGMLAGILIEQGDRNKDNKLSPDEMSRLGGLVFDRIDVQKQGSLKQDSFASGFAEHVMLSQGTPVRGGGNRGGGFIGGMLFSATDANKDGDLSREEFAGTFAKWSKDFDADNSGSLDQEKLAAGLTAAMPRPRGFGGRRSTTPDDNEGFVSIFDGKTLDGWDGDPRYWRAENGEIVGQSSEQVPVEQNTFLIWKAGTTRDFELKIEFKISEGSNSGVQYRSDVLSDIGKWVLKGYQADMDANNMFTGMIYEERGRGFMAPRGQYARRSSDGKSKLIASLGESDALGAFVKKGDWNQLHIVARGNMITQTVNGHLMSALLDEEDSVRKQEGVLGLQIHTGPPMKLQFRNILYKKL